MMRLLLSAVALVILAGCENPAPRETPEATPVRESSEAPTTREPVRLTATLPDGRQVRREERYHISGCERGELVIMNPNIWASADRSGGVAFQLSGTSRTDTCAGAVVEILDFREASGQTMFNIRSVVNGREGWISELFIGKAGE